MEWNDLLSATARFAQVPIDEIDGDSWLIEDLGLDSLALTELLVTLIDEHQVEGLAEKLFELSWERVTLAELYERYCIQAAPDGLGTLP